jgi:hypothetical protein
MCSGRKLLKFQGNLQSQRKHKPKHKEQNTPPKNKENEPPPHTPEKKPESSQDYLKTQTY